MKEKKKLHLRMLLFVLEDITDRLKKDWGINDVWNKLILPRFIRLNEITGKQSLYDNQCMQQDNSCYAIRFAKRIQQKTY